MNKQITITGRPIVKKNSKQVFKTNGRIIVTTSKAYKRFEAEALQQLLTARKHTGLVSVHCDFYVKGKYRVDGDNLYTSITDILQEAKIIQDDVHIMRGSWHKIPGCSGWSTKITIEPYKG